MPQEGVDLTPGKQLLSGPEISKIASLFVQEGVNLIRLTGGEPLVRSDLTEIIGQCFYQTSSCSLLNEKYFPLQSFIYITGEQ